RGRRLSGRLLFRYSQTPGGTSWGFRTVKVSNSPNSANSSGSGLGVERSIWTYRPTFTSLTSSPNWANLSPQGERNRGSFLLITLKTPFQPGDSFVVLF